MRFMRGAYSLFPFFEHPLCAFEYGERAGLDLAADLASDEKSREAAQAIRAAPVDRHEPEPGPASGIGDEGPQFERRPEVMACVQHLRRDHRVFLAFDDHEMTDTKNGLQA